MRYRVTTNGIVYRVERLTNTGFLWWKKMVWKPIVDNGALFYGIYMIVTYDSKEDALVAMNRYIREDAAYYRGFIPVDEHETE